MNPGLAQQGLRIKRFGGIGGGGEGVQVIGSGLGRRRAPSLTGSDITTFGRIQARESV